jgi:hypothetical protein
MITIEHLDLIARQPPRVAGSQSLDYGLGECRRVPYEGRRHLRFDAIKLVVEGGGRHPNSVFVGLIGSMHRGMHPEDDFTHQLHQRGKE